jgi:mannosyltransferase OCH1-like enzyme
MFNWYSNIRFVHFNEYDIYSGRTLSKLNKINETKYKQFYVILKYHIWVIFIRTALLYKYGEIYFDLDVILLKSFSGFF